MRLSCHDRRIGKGAEWVSGPGYHLNIAMCRHQFILPLYYLEPTKLYVLRLATLKASQRMARCGSVEEDETASEKEKIYLLYREVRKKL